MNGPKLGDLPTEGLWTLERDEKHPFGIWGVLTQVDDPGGFHIQTLENPKYLIAPGTYLCERAMYYGGDGVGGKEDYETFRIVIPDWDPDGDGEVDINQHKFHGGNYARQSRGCPLTGMERGYADGGIPAVWRSRHAHSLFMDQLKGLGYFWLEIRNKWEDNA